ncbi:MAG: peptide chain release factor 2 [Thiotrichales bacterium]|jgi:peptide chain release factor 2|nr:peptide chain release factor 2 [Thiotrichales bacterium]MBT3854360.1 peptide chain release factor 2 [Thiotrichales bacterium]MBT4653555.1 peptide chain release factor 2 [Thiotrichales bacterium]MBT6771998.1 peptide chain release factor 2 [Thiotrichales bacterium]MBT7150029.1 peptide chain release factor 2 [Thiotrichales bacterium]
MELSAYYQKISELIDRLNILSKYLKLDEKQDRLEEVKLELENPDIWSNPDKAQALGKEKVQLDKICETFSNSSSILNDAKELLEMAEIENDSDAVNGIITDLNETENSITTYEFERMFSGEMDQNSAYLDIQSGSGGTEAQDWAEMILRMYLRWGDKHNFKVKLMEVSAGDVAGIKSATIHFDGEYAFGWLRSEIGIHRLVRKSPYNANGKRHTSFSSVFVSPEIDDDIEIVIDPSDLRIDTYRASGAGGQHVNKTESAVRITHLPTSTVVQCQDGRSQHSNKDQAMKQLKSKLYELEIQKRNADKKDVEDLKSDIGWGHQIRSYVLDQSRIKDLRTGVESTNTQDVLDGNLDQFIVASLKAGL